VRLERERERKAEPLPLSLSKHLGSLPVLSVILLLFKRPLALQKPPKPTQATVNSSQGGATAKNERRENLGLPGFCPVGSTLLGALK